MKSFCLLFFMSILLLACKTSEKSEEEIIKSNITGEATVEKMEDGRTTCVKCKNGYKKCCTKPKSPIVNCKTKSGYCSN